jgi:protein SCO1
MAATRRRLITLGLAALLPWALPGCDAPRPSAFKAIDITGAEYAQDLGLPDTEGRVRHIAEFKGKLVVVFFGFTQCPWAPMASGCRVSSSASTPNATRPRF